MRGLHVRQVSKSPCRFYGLRRTVLAFSLLEDSGWDAHANKFNFYQGSDLVLVYGIRTRKTGGYATYQRASRIAFAFCELDCDPQSQNRALVSQNLSQERVRGRPEGTGEPVQHGTFWYWNLTLLPASGDSLPANALVLGPGDSTQRHAFHNCILHGGGMPDIYVRGSDPSLESRSHNLYTGLSHWQSDRRGWKPGTKEAIGPLSTRLRGKDMRAVIATEIAPHFPRFTDWDVDINGRRVDWSAALLGSG